MKRNYELNELNEFQRLNLAAKAANDNESTIRIHTNEVAKSNSSKICYIREIRS